MKKCHTYAGRIVLAMALCAIFSIAPASGKEVRSLDDHIVETEAGLYYIVQPGDTLWDLSDRFSNSPWLWPDLWKENKEIANPHLIYPGQRIRIYRRVDLDNLTAEGFTAEAIPHGAFTFKAMDEVGFIRYPSLPPSGILFHVRDPKKMINTNDIVYIRPEIMEDFTTGDRFTVYRTLKPLREKGKGEINGVQHVINGVVEILATQPDVVTAKVIETYRPIEIEDKVTPYMERPFTIPLQESTVGIEGKIMFGEDPLKMIAEHHIAFIDAGNDKGIKPGQLYTAYDQQLKETDIGGRASILLPKYSIGRVMVLHVEDHTSTVLVTQSDKPLAPDTKICTPF